MGQQATTMTPADEPEKLHSVTAEAPGLGQDLADAVCTNQTPINVNQPCTDETVPEESPMGYKLSEEDVLKLLKDEIAQTNKQWCGALEGHNLEDLQNLYTEDAKVYNCPGCPPEAGRQDLEKLLQWFSQYEVTNVKLSAKEIQPGSANKTGSTIWDREKYFLQHDSIVKFNGNKVVVWKREDNRLKIYIDSWNQVNNVN
ncbi:uncharacterized protein [Amphiura filiformis]|uniref:uncharacterized protein n=1 Tax=Amphiura filiformis TaxID=82378 RepID=UPI003B20CE86